MRLLMRDPALAERYMLDIYRAFVTDPFSVGQYRRFLQCFLKGSDRAILWHCTAGKDRAGFGAVILEEALGVARDDVFADYLATNDYLEGEIEKLSAALSAFFGAATEDAARSMRYVYGAREAFLQTSYRCAEESYGSFEGFLKNGLGLTDADRDTLRQAYLEPNA